MISGSTNASVFEQSAALLFYINLVIKCKLINFGNYYARLNTFFYLHVFIYGYLT